MITDRDIQILLLFVRYYVLSRQQVQRLAFPNDGSGRVTRRRLQVLVEQHLISRQNMLFCHPTQTPAPVYFLTRKGCELLSEHLGDEKYLASTTQPPIAHHTFHWLAVSDTHIAFDEGVAREKAVKLDGWINEWDVVNKDESVPERRFRLYTLIEESPRLVCAPDAAFLLTVAGYSKVFYLEQDRGTSGVHQIANSKTKGYAVMAERKLHRRHFASTLDEFTVLMIAPNGRRRDALRKAIEPKSGAHLWRFAAASDLHPDSLFSAQAFFACAGDAQPLVKASLLSAANE